MAMVGFGFVEILILLFSLGGIGLPVGLPPAEENPRMAKIAPEVCSFYLSWAAMATPDANSENHAEQLLAEKEVQQFAKQIEGALMAVLAKKAGAGPENVLVSEIPKLVKTILTRATAIYVGQINVGAIGLELDAGALVHTGENQKEFQASIARLEATVNGRIEKVEVAGIHCQMLTPSEKAPPILWGFVGQYFIVGAGERSIEKIVQRMRGEAPAWLTDLKEKMPVPRRSSVAYINVEKMLALSDAIDSDAKVKALISATGVENVTHLASISGLDEKGVVTQTQIGIHGKPQGIFAIAGGKPLAAGDLAPIPQDATWAIATRLDPEKIFRLIQESASQIDPRARAEFDRGVQEIEQTLSLNLSEDVFQSLGDTWRVYNSPGEGGLVVTGLTGVVSVRDHDRLAKTLGKLEELVQAESRRRAERADGRRVRRDVTIKNFTHAGQKVYFLNFVGEDSPVAPSWCLTDHELIIATFPSHVKAYLSRSKDTKSLAVNPRVAKLLASKQAPMMIGFQDTKAMFKLAYPALQIFGQFACSELQKEGVDINISMLPTMASISRHLSTDVTTITQTEKGIEIVSRQTVPLNIGSAAAAVLPMLLGVRSVRSSHARAVRDLEHAAHEHADHDH